MATDESLFDLYFEYVKDTEPPIIYHRWSLITAIAAYLGRSFYLPFGANKIYPNQYVMLVGSPGTRKSTAIKTAKRLISDGGYDKFAAERTSKEKFLLDLEGETYEDQSGRLQKNVDTSGRDVLRNLNLDDSSETHDGIPKEVFIAADEFNQFAGAGNLDFLSLLGVFWDWDDEATTYKHRFKNSKSVSIYQPTVTILGGNTHSSLQDAFPAATIGQGFLSRIILVHSEPSGRKITFPTPPSAQLSNKLLEQLSRIKQNVRGPASRTGSASHALDMIYRSWNELDDYRFKHYSSRRFTHLLKLSLVVTAMRASTTIDQADVVLANTILSYTENQMHKALGEFGNAKTAQAAHIIMTSLYEAKGALKFDDLWKKVSRDLDKRDQLIEVINNLKAAEKITFVKELNGFIPRQKQANAKAMFVNFNLLKEYTGK